MWTYIPKLEREHLFFGEKDSPELSRPETEDAQRRTKPKAARPVQTLGFLVPWLLMLKLCQKWVAKWYQSPLDPHQREGSAASLHFRRQSSCMAYVALRRSNGIENDPVNPCWKSGLPILAWVMCIHLLRLSLVSATSWWICQGILQC